MNGLVEPLCPLRFAWSRAIDVLGWAASYRAHLFKTKRRGGTAQARDGHDAERIALDGEESLTLIRGSVVREGVKAPTSEQASHLVNRIRPDAMDLVKAVRNPPASEDEMTEYDLEGARPAVEVVLREAQDLLPAARLVQPRGMPRQDSSGAPELEDEDSPGPEASTQGCEAGEDVRRTKEISDGSKHAHCRIMWFGHGEGAHVPSDEAKGAAEPPRLPTGNRQLGLRRIEARNAIPAPDEEDRVVPRPAAEIEDPLDPSVREPLEDPLKEGDIASVVHQILVEQVVVGSESRVRITRRADHR